MHRASPRTDDWRPGGGDADDGGVSAQRAAAHFVYTRYTPDKPRPLPAVTLHGKPFSRRALIDCVLTANGKPLRSGFARLMKSRAASHILCDMFWWVYLRYLIGVDDAKGRRKSVELSLRRNMQRINSVTRLVLAGRHASFNKQPDPSQKRGGRGKGKTGKGGGEGNQVAAHPGQDSDWDCKLPWHMYPEKTPVGKREYTLVSKTTAPGTVQHGLTVDAIKVPCMAPSARSGSPASSRSTSPLSSMSASSRGSSRGRGGASPSTTPSTAALAKRSPSASPSPGSRPRLQAGRKLSAQRLQQQQQLYPPTTSSGSGFCGARTREDRGDGDGTFGISPLAPPGLEGDGGEGAFGDAPEGDVTGGVSPSPALPLAAGGGVLRGPAGTHPRSGLGSPPPQALPHKWKVSARMMTSELHQKVLRAAKKASMIVKIAAPSEDPGHPPAPSLDGSASAPVSLGPSASARPGEAGDKTPPPHPQGATRAVGLTDSAPRGNGGDAVFVDTSLFAEGIDEVTPARFLAASIEEQEDFVESEEHELFDRIARNYLRVLRAVCARRARAVSDMYHKLFPDVMAQAVCHAVRCTVPYSSFYTEEIQSDTLGFLSYWFLGVHRTATEHWPDIHPGGAGGGSLSRKGSGQRPSGGGVARVHAPAPAPHGSGSIGGRSPHSRLRSPAGPASDGSPMATPAHTPVPPRGGGARAANSPSPTPHPAALLSPSAASAAPTLDSSGGLTPSAAAAAAGGVSIGTTLRMKRLAHPKKSPGGATLPHAGPGARGAARRGSARGGGPAGGGAAAGSEADLQAAKEMHELSTTLHAIRTRRHHRKPLGPHSAERGGDAVVPGDAGGGEVGDDAQGAGAPPPEKTVKEENDRGSVRVHGTVRKLHVIPKDIRERMAEYADGPTERAWFEFGRNTAYKHTKRVAVGNFCYTDFSPIVQHVHQQTCREKGVTKPADMLWSIAPQG